MQKLFFSQKLARWNLKIKILKSHQKDYYIIY